MKLAAWMKANKHDDKSFGALVGRDRSQIYRIRKGLSTPPDALKLRIADKTQGEVGIHEWFAAVPPAPAETRDQAA